MLITFHVSRLSCLWEGFAQTLPALEYLNITKCDELTCLRKPGFELENLGGLKILLMDGCDGVVFLEEQGLLWNLLYLQLKSCFKLEKLPNAMHTHISLEYLAINNCLKLVSFPETGFPPMLKALQVENCGVLETLPDGMM